MQTKKFSALALILCLGLLFGIGYATTTLASEAANAEVPADVKFHDIVDVNFVMEHIKVPMPEDVMIIDSRPKRKKYDKGHIPMAVNIPIPQHTQRHWPTEGSSLPTRDSRTAKPCCWVSAADWVWATFCGSSSAAI